MARTIIALLLIGFAPTSARAAAASPVQTTNVREAIGAQCPAAAGDNSTDDTAAVQCHLDYMYDTYGGGIVYFPPGNYLVSHGGVIVRGSVQIQGNGRLGTGINSEYADSSVVTFDAATCKSGAAMNDISVYGYANAAATTNAVTVGANCAVNLENDIIWFGSTALYEMGSGGIIENCIIWGYNYNVYSQGANSYIRDKLDPPGNFASGTAFYQGTLVAGAPSTRNFIEECDLDGDYQYSFQVQDPTNTAVTVVESSHFSNAIDINGGASTAIVGTIAGSTLTVSPNSGNVSLSADYFVDPTQVAGGGSNVYDGGGNVNLTFNPSAACTSNGSCSNLCGTGVDNCGNACTSSAGCNSGPYASPPIAPAPPAVVVSTSSSSNGTTDVTSAIPGSCPAAKGDGTDDDTAAIQCHLDYMLNTFGAGLVYIPAGTYLITGGGLTAGMGIEIKGAGPTQSILKVDSDSTALSYSPAGCPQGGGYSSLSSMAVYGYQNASATTDAVTVGANCVVDFSNDVLEYGRAALYDQGSDGMIEASTIEGYQYGVFSTMGQWYINDTLSALGSSGVGFEQQGSISADNTFEGCTFSGSLYSAQFQDAQVDNIVQNSTFTSPVMDQGSWLIELVGDQTEGGVENPSNDPIVVADSPTSTPPQASPQPPAAPQPPASPQSPSTPQSPASPQTPPTQYPSGAILVQSNQGSLKFGDPQMVGQTGNQILFGDVEGLGRADLIQVTSGGELLVQSNQGNLIFGDPQSIGQTGNQVLFADVEGIGRADLIQITPQGEVWVQHNNGDLTFGDPQTVAQTGNQVLFADVEGQGRADLIQITPGGSIEVQPNEGDLVFGAPQTVGQTGNTVLFADVEGGGLADLIQVKK